MLLTGKAALKKWALALWAGVKPKLLFSAKAAVRMASLIGACDRRPQAQSFHIAYSRQYSDPLIALRQLTTATRFSKLPKRRAGVSH